MADLTTYTISYSEVVQGFPSYYSFVPDYMIGMNQHFYSFKGGNLWKHNTNELRNNFYGVQYNTIIRGVFNQEPLSNKRYKTIALESSHRWIGLFETDVKPNGFVEKNWFEKKENVFYSFIRTDATVPAPETEYELRSLSGIGRSSSVSINGLDTTINFSISPYVAINSQLSIGDLFYYAIPPYDTPQLAGTVKLIERDLVNGINRVVIDTSIAGSSAIPIQDAYMLYIKNNIAESYGLLGHYCVFEFENNDTDAVNMFAVRSEVFKSYP